MPSKSPRANDKAYFLRFLLAHELDAFCEAT